MKILFVSTHVPVPANNGQAIRTSSVVRGLASLGHELTFVSFAPDPAPPTLAPLSACCKDVDLLRGRWKLKNMSHGTDFIGRLLSLLVSRPYSIERFRSRAMRSRIEHHLRASRPDLVVCDSLYALVNLPPTDVPIVLNCHNVEHVIVQRYAQLEENRLKRWYASIESRLLSGAERTACLRASFAMACSEHDCDLLKTIRPDLPVFVVPNAVDTDLLYCEAPPECDGAAPVVLYHGGMDWYPNRDAVEFFVDRILPLIGEACPDVKVVVAGRNASAPFVDKFRNDPRIHFTGTVPDMAPYVSAATVVVVPLRLGSGTRIKILEACAAAKSVVSTSIGAEGLQLQHGKEILLADSPEEFANAVLSLIQNAALREELGRAARSVILRRYSEAALERSLAAALSCFKDSGRAVALVPSEVSTYLK
jgi:polysaccharide biosynthesis protein PslH